MDYRDLLMRYMRHIGDCEGVTFVEKLNDPLSGTTVKFSRKEVDELKKIQTEAEN